MNELQDIFHQFFDETAALFSKGFIQKELKKGDYFLTERQNLIVE